MGNPESKKAVQNRFPPFHLAGNTNEDFASISQQVFTTIVSSKFNHSTEMMVVQLHPS